MVWVRLLEAATGDDMKHDLAFETPPRAGEVIVLEYEEATERYRIKRIEHRFGDQGEPPHFAVFVEEE